MTTAPESADFRAIMVESLIEAVEEGVDVFTLVSDSTSTSLIQPFSTRFPDRLVNVGIAEQNLMGVAAGIALGGCVAVTANAAAFVVHRANEQLKNDVCYSETNVKVAAVNAGVAYGSLGATHHAIDDISILRGMGSILILVPSDPVDAAQIFRFALRHVGPVYLRMDNIQFPRLHDPEYKFAPGSLDILREGGDITVFCTGSVTFEAVSAANELSRHGISVELVNMPSIRPIDREALSREAAKTGLAITVEEHSVHGGIGSIVAETVAEKGLGAKVIRLGIPEGGFAIAGPRAQLRKHYGIDTAGIVLAALRLLGGRDG